MTREPCKHELWEKESACADGMCPLCLGTKVERLNADNKQLKALRMNARSEIERLRAENKWLYDQMAAQKRTAGAAAVAALEPKP